MTRHLKALAACLLLLASLAAAADIRLVPGVRGHALWLDGSKVYLADAAGTQFDLEQGLTVSVWLRPEGWAHLSGILQNIGTFSFLYRNGGGFYFWDTQKKEAATLLWAPKAFPVRMNQWNHIAFTYDQKGHAVGYLNGKKVAEQLPGNDPAVRILSRNPRRTCFFIGHGSSRGAYRGAIDEVFIYGRALADAEVAALAKGDAPAGALAAFLWDDPAKPLADSSPAKRSLVTLGGTTRQPVETTIPVDNSAPTAAPAPAKPAAAPAPVPQPTRPVKLVPGVRGQAIWLDGLHTYLSEPTRAPFALDQGLTFALWIKAERWGHLAGILQNIGSFSFLKRRQGGFYFWDTRSRYPASMLWAPDAFPETLNQWQHVAFTYDQKGTAIAYLNGKKVAEQLPGQEEKGQGIVRFLNRHPTQTFRFDIGRGSFQGALDEVYIYGRVLSAAEVADLAKGNAPDGPIAAYLWDDSAQPLADSSPARRHLQTMEGAQGKDAPVLGGVVDLPAAAANDRLVAWCQSSVVRVFQKDRLAKVKVEERVAAELAGNEYESFQLVLSPKADLAKVNLAIPPFTLGGTQIPVEVRRVDYVMIPEPSNIMVPNLRATNVYGEIVSAFPGKPNPPGWYPDPLPRLAPDLALKGGLSHAFWITVKSPANAPAGIYRTTAKVTAAGGLALDIPLSIRVRGFSLPEEKLFTHTVAVTHAINNGAPLEEFYRILSRYYLSGDCTRAPIGIKFLPDGKVELDTAEWDREMELAVGKYRQKVIYLPTIGFYGIPKAANHARTWCGIQVSQGHGVMTEEFRNKFGAYLKAISAHLKEKGWLDRTRITLVDEPHTRDDFRLCHDVSLLVRQCAPDLLIETTKWPTRESIGISDVWCLGAFQPDQIEKAIARGEIIEQYPNWHLLIDRPVMDRRMFGFQMWKYHVSGILHYSIGRGWEDPASLRSPHLRYPDGRVIYGSGIIMYPEKDGVPMPSARISTIRDALEDYEAIRILEQLAARNPAHPDAKEALQYLKNAADQICPSYECRGKGLKIGFQDYRWSLDTGLLLECRRGIMDRIEKLQKLQ